MMQLGRQQISIWLKPDRDRQARCCKAGLVDELIVYVAPKLLWNPCAGIMRIAA
ncbi:hypothetical protein KCP73_05725 [Salmonella enterica subsp. enterica]|nr:hypothetical protein KCP73_05725 [Salmonella enterica subsp. enterica]